MVQKQSDLVEIGSGEDGHYDWISEFSVLDDLTFILVDIESVKRNLEGPKLARFLSDLRKQDANIPKLNTIDDGFDLIINHPSVSVDKEFFDPDMPTSSIWSKVYAERPNIPNLVEFLESAKEQLEAYCERENVPKLLEQKEQEYQKIKQDEERTIELRRIQKGQERKREEDQWVEKAFLNIKNSIRKNSGIVCIDEFLIDVDSQEIFVLTTHKDYKKERSDHEIRVTQKLMELYKVYEIEEGSPPGSGHIPYFAGAGRKNVMGWRQNKSDLFSSDSEGLKKANAIREKYVNFLS